MSTRKVLFLCIGSFVVGLIGGFFLLKYIFPNLSIVEQSLQEEKVYQVEHNVCPEPEVVSTQCSIFVDISGALKTPGVYCLDPGDRVIDAVKKAGGFSGNVSLEYAARSINLSKVLVNNQKIYIPSKEELLCELKPFTLKEEEILPQNSEENTKPEGDITDNPVTNSCININTATITQLDSLDGIGPSTAQKIVDSRPYNSLTDLLNVSGIGQATYDKFKDNICI
ncbi:helix-hairpin-helix domain-containing protein [Patescibacteria group bacterium]|nr:helix-hairpin-helix domain-containing protein [Patescibacteria group bacterium]